MSFLMTYLLPFLDFFLGYSKAPVAAEERRLKLCSEPETVPIEREEQNEENINSGGWWKRGNGFIIVSICFWVYHCLSIYSSLIFLYQGRYMVRFFNIPYNDDIALFKGSFFSTDNLDW